MNKIITFLKKILFKNDKDTALRKSLRKLHSILNVRKLISQPSLQYFEAHLTEHCNLNCVYCNHFSPLAKPEYLDLEKYEKDLIRLKTLTKGILKDIHLLGGEPLLHPKVNDFMTVSRRYFPNSKITVVTNGILLLKMDDDFWQTCAKEKINIIISAYPIKLDKEAIAKKAQDYDWTRERGGSFIEFTEFKTMYQHCLNLDGNGNKLLNYLKCSPSVCTFLYEGKLFPCAIVANIRHFNGYFGKNLPVAQDDYIDIYKAKDIKEILKFLSKPISFCRYCNMDKKSFMHPWKVSDKKIDEWV
ncbi:MAG: radical SAM protein [Elusimicrobiota bacterium]|nr:radical SAM protein [Elusimicrobiota bacterium]